MRESHVERETHDVRIPGGCVACGGDLLVRVRYSSLNYKDALSATGHPGVTRQFRSARWDCCKDFHEPLGADGAGHEETTACDQLRVVDRQRENLAVIRDSAAQRLPGNSIPAGDLVGAGTVGGVRPHGRAAAHRHAGLPGRHPGR